MITIKSNKDLECKIVISDNELQENELGYMLINRNYFDLISLVFIVEEEKKVKSITRIEKRLGANSNATSGDIIKKYNNYIINDHEMLLTHSDFIEVSNLIHTLKEEDKNRLRVIKKAFSELIAYECYITYIRYEMNHVPIMEIFDDVCRDSIYSSETKEYQKDILDKAKEILRKEYKVNLDYVFNGGIDL